VLDLGGDRGEIGEALLDSMRLQATADEHDAPRRQ